MNTTRRSFFGLLAGLAVCPFSGQRPDNDWSPTNKYGWAARKPYAYNYSYKNVVCDDVVSTKNSIDPKTYDDYCKVFTWTYEPGTLYWSKNAENNS